MFKLSKTAEESVGVSGEARMTKAQGLKGTGFPWYHLSHLDDLVGIEPWAEIEPYPRQTLNKVINFKMLHGQ